MTTNIDFSKLTGDEVETIVALNELHQTAQKMYETVLTKQKVGLIGDHHTVWKDSYNEEYLQRTDDGWEWVASYLHQYYVVPICKDSIFSIMRDGYFHDRDPDKRGRTNKSSQAIGYFRSYVNRLK